MLQGSDEWHLARTGKITASRVADIMANGTGRKTYMMELLAERLVGVPEEKYQSTAMLNGIETEAIARSIYEIRHNTIVAACGLVDHPTIKGFAASPDGLLENDGLIEIKCPGAKAHLETLLTGEIPKKYQFQMLAQMACTKRSWCDYVSYNDTLPQNLEYIEIGFPRDDEKIEEMESKVKAFLDELNELEAKLRGIKNNVE